MQGKSDLKSMLQGYLWPLGLALLVGLSVYVGLRWVKPLQLQEPYPENPIAGRLIEARVGEAVLRLEVRDTTEGRELGLSGREGLAEGEGMIFMFPYKIQPVFWMKQMKFDLDVVWVSDGMVVQIDERVAHPTEADPIVKTMPAQQPIDWVIELAAGEVERLGIELGDEVELGQ